MCTSPLIIKNKGLSHYAGRYFNQVPCGKCESCKHVKSMDYFLRAYAIFEKLPLDWSVFFCTFTYRPQDVPKTDFYIYNNAWQLYSLSNVCFNHEHIMRFMKSYQQFYRRLGFGDDKMPKMLFTSEFGESDEHLHLPHYHGIVFVPRHLEWYQFKKEVERYWHYGFTKNIKIHKSPDLINDRSDVNCFKYVTKYVAKGSGYTPVWMNYDHNLFVPSLDDWYRIEPRVHCTNGFGKELELTLKPRNYEINSVTLSVDGSLQTFSIPNYYRRRYYTSSFLLEKFPNDNVPYYPFRVIQRKPYQHYIKRQITLHQNDYDTVQVNQLKESLSVKYQKALNLYHSGGVNLDMFLDSKGESRDDLISYLSSFSKDDFVSSFFKFAWSEHPVLEYEKTKIDTRESFYKVRSRYECGVYDDAVNYKFGLVPFNPIFAKNEYYRMYFSLPEKLTYTRFHERGWYNEDAVFKDPNLYVSFMSAFHACSVYDDYQHYLTLRKQEIDKNNEDIWYNLHGLKKVS